MTVQNYPLSYRSPLVITGLNISVASNTTLSIAAGYAKDADNIIDIALSTATTLNAATTGANGLDTGALANSTIYAIYLVTDTVNKRVCVLASTSLTAPLLPYGYDGKLLIGFALTDGSAHFLPMKQTGYYNEKTYLWGTPISVLSDGASTSDASVDCSAAVPAVSQVDILINASYYPATADDYTTIKYYAATGGYLVYGSVATKMNSIAFALPSVLVTAVPTMEYCNSAGSGKTDILVTGFKHTIL
jgi:hypothetical protein